MGIPLSLMLGETALAGTNIPVHFETVPDSYVNNSMSALKIWFQDLRPHILANKTHLKFLIFSPSPPLQ